MARCAASSAPMSIQTKQGILVKPTPDAPFHERDVLALTASALLTAAWSALADEFLLLGLAEDIEVASTPTPDSETSTTTETTGTEETEEQTEEDEDAWPIEMLIG